MKPVRNYSDGQWLLLLWAFIVFFLATGIFLGSTLVTVVAVLGALGAGYTTFIYLRANGYSLPILASRRTAASDDEYDDDNDEYDDDQFEDEYDDGEYEQDEPGAAAPGGPAPVVDSFQRPAQQSGSQQSGSQQYDPPTSPDLSEGDPR